MEARYAEKLRLYESFKMFYHAPNRYPAAQVKYSPLLIAGNVSIPFCQKEQKNKKGQFRKIQNRPFLNKFYPIF
jgi:hypothetical protein